MNRTRRIFYRHPMVCAQLASAFAEDAATARAAGNGREAGQHQRHANRLVAEGVAAAIAKALNVPGVHVNPCH